MFNIPYFFDYANIITGAGDKPSTSHVHDNRVAVFFKRHLLQRAMSPFKFTLPDNWDHDYFLYVLYCWGFVGVIETTEYGVIPQAGALKGYNVFYRPTDFVVANPLIPLKDYKIDKTCSLIQLTPDYGGIMDIINYYGDLLAVVYESMIMNISNSKLSFVFASGSKKTAESLKKIFDNIQGGDLAAFYDKDLDNLDGSKPWEVFAQDLKKNYITNDLMETLRDIYNQFDTEIGIDNNGVAKKKERVTNVEIHANDDETYTKVDLWFNTIKAGLDNTNEMFYSGSEACKIEWRGGDPFAKTDYNAAESI